MATNEETNAAGTDTRPPMLVENDYESWKIRIHSEDGLGSPSIRNLSGDQAYWAFCNEIASQASKSQPHLKRTTKPDYVSEWCFDYAKQFVEQQLNICYIMLTSIVVPPSSNCLCEDLRSACDREHTKVLELEAEVLKHQKMVIESEKRNSHLQKTHIDLQLKFQNYKQCIDTSSASNAIFEINKLRDQLQGKDTTIRNLNAQFNIMKVLNAGSTEGSCNQQALETDRIQLKDTITSLRIQLDGLKVENVSLKRRYDELSKANTHSRTAYTEKINALTAENAKLKTELSGKKSGGSTASEKPKVLASGMYTKSSKYIPPPKRANWVKPTPLPKKKQVTFQEPPRTSNRPTQKPPVQQNKKPNIPVNQSTRTKPATESRKPMPKYHTRNHHILPSRSVNARRAADHNRKLHVVDHNQFVVRSLKSVNTKTPQAKHSVNHTKKVWKATRNHNVNTTKTATGRYFALYDNCPLTRIMEPIVEPLELTPSVSSSSKVTMISRFTDCKLSDRKAGSKGLSVILRNAEERDVVPPGPTLSEEVDSSSLRTFLALRAGYADSAGSVNRPVTSTESAHIEQPESNNLLGLKRLHGFLEVTAVQVHNGNNAKRYKDVYTAEEKTNKKNDVKARGLLLMALLNEHQLTFSQYPDAKSMFAAIETRFGGNAATKKTLLKQQYENFSATSAESLDSIFNRLQKIVSRLAILGVIIAQEDLNLKFLSSLPPEWNTHVVVWMNKPEVETMSIDDLYNNFKIVEQKVKKTVGTSSGVQNLAFMTGPSSSRTNDANTASSQVSVASPSVNTDVEQIHEDDLEAMDLKWQLSLLSVRVKKYYQRTGKNIFINGNDIFGYDKSKVECYNCHKLEHFARECGAPRSKEGQFRNQDNTKKQGKNEDTSKAMLTIDGVGFD
ncbi:putative ribonuclease H-like domain-containing protein [Tanacetum coccineum]